MIYIQDSHRFLKIIASLGNGKFLLLLDRSTTFIGTMILIGRDSLFKGINFTRLQIKDLLFDLIIQMKNLSHLIEKIKVKLCNLTLCLTIIHPQIQQFNNSELTLMTFNTIFGAY